MTRPCLPIRLLRAAPALLLPLAAAAPSPGAAATPPRSPAVAPYVVVDGREIPEPLAGLKGDPRRGRAAFEDPELGGCSACHAIAGRGRGLAAPRILLDRLAPPPPLAPAIEVQEAEATPGDGIDSLAEAPVSAPMPLSRAEALAEAAEDAAAEAEEVSEAEEMGLTMGGDLTGVGGRMSAGALRLWIVDPAFFGVAAMPGYHAVDFALAAAQPDLRQPWLSPQRIEDIVAYLLAVDGAAAEPEPMDDEEETPGDEAQEAAAAAGGDAPGTAEASPDAGDAAAPEEDAAGAPAGDAAGAAAGPGGRDGGSR